MIVVKSMQGLDVLRLFVSRRRTGHQMLAIVLRRYFSERSEHILFSVLWTQGLVNIIIDRFNLDV